MQTKSKKILKYIIAAFIIISFSTGCAVKKKHHTVPCPHFSLEILK